MTMKAPKVLLKAFFVLGLLAALLVFSLPTLLSTPSGKGWLTRKINENIPGTLTIDTLNLHLFGPQIAQNVHLINDQNESLLKIASLEINENLFTLLFHRGLPSHLHIEDLSAKIEPTKKGTTTIHQSLGMKPQFKNHFAPFELSGVQVDIAMGPALREGSLSLEGNTLQQGISTPFSLSATLGKNLHIKASKFPVIILEQIALLHSPAFAHMLRSGLGEEVNLAIEQTEEGDKVLWSVNAESATFTADFQGELVNNILSLKSPGVLSFVVNQEMINLLSSFGGYNGPLTPQLTGVAQGKFVLDQLFIPLGPEENGKVTAQAYLDVGNATFRDHPVFGIMLLKQLTAKFEVAEDSPSIDMEVQGEATQNGAPMLMHFNVKFDKPGKWRDAAKTVKNNTEFNVDLALQTPLLPDWLGAPLTLHIKGNTSEKELGAAFSLHSHRLQFNNVHLHIDNPFDNGNLENLSLSGLITVENGVIHDRNANALAHLNNVKIPFEVDGKSNRIHLGIDGQLGSGDFESKVDVADWQRDGKVILKDWKIDFNLDAHQDGGIAHFDGKMEHIFDKTVAKMLLEGKMDDFPSHMICRACLFELDEEQRFKAAFGNHVDAKLGIDLKQEEGAVKLHMQGENGSVNIVGAIQQGALTLHEPLTVDMAMTPELGEYVIDDIIPLLSSAQVADSRILLTVDPKGTSIPMRPFSIDRVNVGSGTINLNKIYFTPQGYLGEVLALLNIYPESNFMVWFTPLYFHVQNGTLQIERMDMLVAERYPIATWGKVDFPDNRVRMTVGVSLKALGFNSDESKLNQNYLLQIPLKGSVDHPKLDKGKVAAKLSALAALSSGGSPGVAIGTIIDTILSSNVPPPTTQPFPWDGQTLPVDNEPVKPTKLNPLKGLEKGAKDLFRKLRGKSSRD